MLSKMLWIYLKTLQNYETMIIEFCKIIHLKYYTGCFKKSFTTLIFVKGFVKDQVFVPPFIR